MKIFDDLFGHLFNDPEVKAALAKLVVVWATTLAGITITHLASLVAIFYTLLQIYVTWRDKISKKGRKR